MTALDTHRMAYDSAEEMVFGHALHPVTAGNGVEIGGGQVWPEVKFTLPPMTLNEDTLPKARELFGEMAREILEKAVFLHQPALVLEFEHLYELTLNPEWGAAVTADLREIIDAFTAEHDLRVALRVTVADIRDQARPPRMRSGEQLQRMLEAFELSAQAGADILSIESTGGKEISDRALMEANIDGLAYALGVLAPRDMSSLWSQIVEIAERHGIVPGGDTACGFGNTAMQLANQKMLPKTLAAVVRLMTAPRSLVAVREGAVGPLKDCGYENPIIKAITGVPISMEGKSAACAHSSPLGNIAAAVADLWSNEAVQQTRLLAGNAPEAFAEILIYDTRLMNEALKDDGGPWLRDLLVASDRNLDPQAVVMDPAVHVEAGRRILAAGDDPYAQTLALARLALEVLHDAIDTGDLELEVADARWLERLDQQVEALPDDPNELAARLPAHYRDLFLPTEYGLHEDGTIPESVAVPSPVPTTL